jgi:tetratricopeptide (TPR) repeat protein
VLRWDGEFTESLSLSEECLAICDDLGSLARLSAIHRNVGDTKAYLGQHEEARVHLQRGLALAGEVHSRSGLGAALFSLGQLALAEEECTEAERWLQKSVALFQESGARSEVGRPLALLAGAARGLGQLPAARKNLCEALHISAEIRRVYTPVYALPVAALLLADLGETERAIDIYALASRHGFVANSRLWEDIAGRRLSALAATLPPDVVAAAQERGRTRDLWTTVEELLTELEG